ncbi:unnamed protein product [Cylindrotheca closterium]|uniref:SET domain-containing protein n=1 Tax=Cylindrotheca closterium TaxID=2856 RepID=A0AAD2CG20_9STRA|nr:unnamed protein product [Cylindrotheca closterium]
MLRWNKQGSIWLALVAILVNFISSHTCSAIQCNVFLAESTIPNAGLGIFSGVELNPGDPVGNGDVCIPIFNVEKHHEEPSDAINDYVWAGEVMGMKLEAAPDLIEANCLGLDSALNCNLALINVARAKPKYDDAGLHRSHDPAAGSITPYHNGTTRATIKVPIGGELFKHYGDEWFKGRPDLFGESFPLTEDFASAEEIINDAFSFGEETARSILEEVIFPMQRIWGSRVMNAIPKTIDEASIAFREGIEMVYQPNATRSINWLQEHGKCVDHIIPKQSTIEGAGRGAFAKRGLPKGTIITGSPLHHIPMKDNFIPIFRTLRTDANSDEAPRREIAGQQLLLNYCFGHSESTLLLCPYGAGIGYINHNQTRTNVKVVWPDDGLMSHDETWLRKQPEEMIEFSGAHLALDYVATRDIAAGEELFLDYGDDWEEAWNGHATNWKSERIWSSSYASAKRWNEKVDGIPLRTAEETSTDPYPANLHVRCHSELDEDDWGSFEEWPASEYGYPCEIKERKKDTKGQDIYSVRLVTEKYDRWDTEFESPQVLDIDGVPRSAIRFFDAPFTTDLHLRGAFRLPIGIPEAIMPAEWKNVPFSVYSDP